MSGWRLFPSSFLFYSFSGDVGGPLSTVGFAWAHAPANADTVAMVEPGIVPRCSSSVLFNVGSISSSSDESFNSLSLGLSFWWLLADLCWDIISKHLYLKCLRYLTSYIYFSYKCYLTSPATDRLLVLWSFSAVSSSSTPVLLHSSGASGSKNGPGAPYVQHVLLRT